LFSTTNKTGRFQSAAMFKSLLQATAKEELEPFSRVIE